MVSNPSRKFYDLIRRRLSLAPATKPFFAATGNIILALSGGTTRLNDMPQFSRSSRPFSQACVGGGRRSASVVAFENIFFP